MKTAIIYYSLEGNTKYAVDRIAAAVDSDIIELVPVKPYPTKGPTKFLIGGKDTVGGKKPQLKPYDFDASKYDRIILAGPVWAARWAAPFNTFLNDHKEALQKIGCENTGVVLCQSGNGAEKAIEQLRKILGGGKFAAETVLIDPLKKQEKKAENDIAIDEFCKAF